MKKCFLSCLLFLPRNVNSHHMYVCINIGYMRSFFLKRKRKKGKRIQINHSIPRWRYDTTELVSCALKAYWKEKRGKEINTRPSLCMYLSSLTLKAYTLKGNSRQHIYIDKEKEELMESVWAQMLSQIKMTFYKTETITSWRETIIVIHHHS